MLKNQLTKQLKQRKVRQIQNKYKHLKHGDKNVYLSTDKNVCNNLEKIIHKQYLKCIQNQTKV